MKTDFGIAAPTVPGTYRPDSTPLRVMPSDGRAAMTSGRWYALGMIVGAMLGAGYVGHCEGLRQLAAEREAYQRGIVREQEKVNRAIMAGEVVIRDREGKLIQRWD